MSGKTSHPHLAIVNRQRAVLKRHCVYQAIWLVVGSVIRAAALRRSKPQMEVSRGPAHLSFCPLLFLSLRLFVPLSRSFLPTLSIHLFSCTLEILTDPLEELRDSISRQQNGAVVLGNTVPLER